MPKAMPADPHAVLDATSAPTREGATMSRPLRVGLLVITDALNAWEHAMVERLKEAAHVELPLIVQRKEGKDTKSIWQKVSDLQKVVDRRDYLLYHAYRELDRRLFSVVPDASAKKGSLQALLPGADVLPVEPRRTRYSTYFKPQSLSVIEEHDIDVLLRVNGYGIFRGDILNVARYGIWSYHNGDNRVNRGGPAGFWEVVEGHPTTGTVLQILNEDLDNGQVIYRSLGSTDHVSVRRNRNKMFWKALSFAPRALAELHYKGPERFFEEVERENENVEFYSNRLYRIPDTRELAPKLLRHLMRVLFEKLKAKLSTPQWSLMYDLREGLSTSPWRFEQLRPPRDRYWADPHVLHRDDRYYVFVEEYPYDTGKGHISVLTIDEEGEHGPPVRAIEEPYHLSYPFVFEWEGQCYMIPESAANQTIDLYKCTRFPDEWEHYKTLVEGVRAVDPTLLFREDTWWLFANVEQQKGAEADDELFLFYADAFDSTDWTPHPRNPVVSDVRRARPAGAFFKHKDVLYRPSQDSSHRYGYGLNFNRVIRLTKEEYVEEKVTGLTPDWRKGLRRVHSFAHAGRLTMVDGLERRPRLPDWLMKS